VKNLKLSTANSDGARVLMSLHQGDQAPRKDGKSLDEGEFTLKEGAVQRGKGRQDVGNRMKPSERGLGGGEKNRRFVAGAGSCKKEGQGERSRSRTNFCAWRPCWPHCRDKGKAEKREEPSF